MRTQLLSHNKTAYQKVMKAFETSDRTCVVHPTGTGKSYLIAAVSESYNKVLILGPNVFVLDQVHNVLNWRKEGVEYMTYILLMMKEEMPTSYDLICLDEFHRAGAHEWGAAVLRLLDANQQAKVFGTTATPIRYLDNERNMADELFGGNVASHITIGQAWSQSILPMPTYVTGLFDFMHTIVDAEERIRKSNRVSDEDKRKSLFRLSNVRLEWENSMGMPSILQRHLDKDIRRVLIFCADISRLRSMRETVIGWFRMAGFTIASSHTMHHNMTDRSLRKAMHGFESDEGDGVRLMFSVNMLNEGIHIPRVGAVLMLRTTSSRIIYLQQMGRCLTAANTEKPVVLDMVDNITTTTAVHGMTDMEHWLDIVSGGEIGDLPTCFRVVDYRKSIREVLEKLSPQELSNTPFEESFRLVREFCEEHGRHPSNNEIVMYRYWVRLYNHRDKPEVQELLDKYTKKIDYPEFDERVEQLAKFCEMHSRFPNHDTDKSEYNNLVNIRVWQRRNGVDPRFAELEKKYGFYWTDETIVERLVAFVKEHDRLPSASASVSNDERTLRSYLVKSKHLHGHPKIAPILERFPLVRKSLDERIRLLQDFCERNGRRPKVSDGRPIAQLWQSITRDHKDDPRVKALTEKYPLAKWKKTDDEMREYLQPIIDYIDTYHCRPPYGRKNTTNGDLGRRITALRLHYASHPLVVPVLKLMESLPLTISKDADIRTQQVKQRLIAFVGEHHRFPRKSSDGSDEERKLYTAWMTRRDRLNGDPEIQALRDRYIASHYEFDEIYPTVKAYFDEHGHAPTQKDGRHSKVFLYWCSLKTTFRERTEVHELLKICADRNTAASIETRIDRYEAFLREHGHHARRNENQEEYELWRVLIRHSSTNPRINAIVEKYGRSYKQWKQQQKV